MRKQIEHFLLSFLLGTTVLLGLTFWLNTYFGFNIFSSIHWQELASMQASGQPIDKDFYISMGVAVVMFIVGLHIIYGPRFRKISKTENTVFHQPDIISNEKKSNITAVTTTVAKTEQPTNQQPIPTPAPIPEQGINLTRPPKLNLPKNIAQIAANQFAQQQPQIIQSDKYNDDLSKIFSDNFYMVKKNSAITGFTPNLFAIGYNEVVWIGGVDCDIKKLQNAVNKLDSTFKETLEDIPITINSFIIDTNHTYNSDERIHIFHTLDELKEYLKQNPTQPVPDNDREDFNAFSDYIDTVLTLLYKT